jgi:hypothetical protein
MVLYVYVLIMFSLHRELLKLILVMNPFPRWFCHTPAQGNYTFIVIAVEYFTKWIEAKLLTNVSSATIKKFSSQNIIFRYGVPKHIIVDTLIMQCSKNSANKSARRLPSHQYTTRNQTEQWKSQLFDFPCNEEDIGGREKKWAEAMPIEV